MCHKKGFGALDKYWESLTSLIWPRFNMLMQMNTQSIKECDPLKMKAVDQGRSSIGIFGPTRGGAVV